MTSAHSPHDSGDSVATIRLGNQDFALVRKSVPVASLRLDPANQRLSHLIHSQSQALDDAALHSLIWDMEPVKDLYNSILQNGGLITDPIVTPDATVLEGNCRTVCLRELHRRYPLDSRWTHTFVQEVPSDASDEQITMLIGELHIAGKIEWRAYEQAHYVWKMHRLFGRTLDYLAAHLRLSRSQVAQKIAAYEETATYIAEAHDPDAVSRFSHFEELMRKPALRQRREEDPDFMVSFRKWVKEGRFLDARDVRHLATILDDPAAFAAFEAGGATAARGTLQAADPARLSSLWAAVDRVADDLRTIPLLEMSDLRGGDTAKIGKLRELREAIDLLAGRAGISL